MFGQIREMYDGPREWFLAFRLRNGADPAYQCDEAATVRLRKALANGTGFFVFDAPDRRVAVNVGEISAVRILWNPAGQSAPAAELERIRVRFTAPSPHDRYEEYGADPDEPDEDGLGQLGGLLYSLELGPDAGEFLSFEDEDGELVMLRADDVATIEVPLRLLTVGETDEHRTVSG